MKIRNLLPLFLLAVFAALLAGCSTTASYMVKDAGLKEVKAALEDYARASGGKAVISDDVAGDYRLATKQGAILEMTMTSLEGSVYIEAGSVGADDVSGEFGDFLSHLQDKGYAVQEVIRMHAEKSFKWQKTIKIDLKKLKVRRH
ncbi:MAG TPA: hypothetical protein VMD02_07630 [Candidatus Omnitrophota bacterium]|nr:hypothetical protein [Candidatus Omnitrophota bacterium]